MATAKQAFSQGRMLVFGHRGACGYAPMNTIPSFEKALEQGADGTEFDVRLSKDGHVVILHDDTVDATTDGHGVVHEMTLAQIRELDAGGWFAERFRGTRIPTLDEVLETLGRRVVINIEIKAESFDAHGLEQRVAQAVARHAVEEYVVISSFNPLSLRRFHKIAPHIPIAYLHHPEIPFFLPMLMTGLPHESRNPHYSEVTPGYMQWARKHGYRVNTYTVNDPAVARSMRDLGVDSVITDVPDVIFAALRE